MAIQPAVRRKKVSVLGASGYSGQELLRRLIDHPGAELVHAFAHTAAGNSLSDLLPSLRGRTSLALEEFSVEAAAESEAAFVALPSGEALRVVPQLLEKGLTVIDLGGDFRLKDGSSYERYYGRQHPFPALLESAVYGLSEWNRKALANASLIANPGCYPTSVLLAVLPLLTEHLIEGGSISVSSMSGVSGAGRSATLELSFAEVNESVRAYKVGVHQHQPEIQTYCQNFSGTPARVNFVAHLLPITRGIYSTIFAQVNQNVDLPRIASTFERSYGTEPFVRICGSKPPEIGQVRGTNRIDIGFVLDSGTGQVTILSAIDNLVKGAAGQAIQNFNIRYGFNETEGLA
jgi:N-acetyl-gamma-glutamyl-phosphate reductase